MVSVRCTLTFSDGTKLCGNLQAQYPGQRPTIAYSGEKGRVKFLLSEAAPAEMELMFRVISEGENALLAVERNGEYESRAGLSMRDRIFNSHKH